MPASSLLVDGKTMLNVKRVYERAAESDGLRILVDRLWPRGVSKAEAKVHGWMKDIAPSDKLRRWFQHDPDRWDEFRRRYMKELESKEGDVAMLLRHAREGDLTLVYSARDERHNNAVVLKEFLDTRVRAGRSRRR